MTFLFTDLVESASPDHALRLVGPFSVTGMVIGDVALDWAETAVAIDGADRHPLYPPVAGFASLGATFAGALERAEVRADASVQVGNNLSLSTAMVTRSLIALRCGAWPAALAAAVQLARRQIEFGQIVSLFSSMDSALIALWGLDRPEAAAVLLGKSRALEGRVHPDWMTVLLAEVEASLRQNPGASRFAELTAEGATLDNAAAAFLAEQAALALDEG